VVGRLVVGRCCRLVVAWGAVRGITGAGTAGVDGIAPRSVGFGAGELLTGLRAQLKAGQFVPQRVREKGLGCGADEGCEIAAGRPAAFANGGEQIGNLGPVERPPLGTPASVGRSSPRVSIGANFGLYADLGTPISQLR